MMYPTPITRQYPRQPAHRTRIPRSGSMKPLPDPQVLKIQEYFEEGVRLLELKEYKQGKKLLPSGQRTGYRTMTRPWSWYAWKALKKQALKLPGFLLIKPIIKNAYPSLSKCFRTFPATLTWSARLTRRGTGWIIRYCTTGLFTISSSQPDRISRSSASPAITCPKAITSG